MWTDRTTGRSSEYRMCSGQRLLPMMVSVRDIFLCFSFIMNVEAFCIFLTPLPAGYRYKDRIENAMYEIEFNSCLRFVKKTKEDEDYVVLYDDQLE